MTPKPYGRKLAVLFLLVFSLLTAKKLVAQTKITGENYVDLSFAEMLDSNFIDTIKSKLNLPTSSQTVPQCKLESTNQAFCSYSFGSVHAANFFFIKILKTAPFNGSNANYAASSYFEAESDRSLYSNASDTTSFTSVGYEKVKTRKRGDGYFGIMGLKDNFVVEVFSASALGNEYSTKIFIDIGQRIGQAWSKKTADKKEGETAKAIDFDYGKSYGLNKAVVSTYNGGTTGVVDVVVDRGILLEKLLLKNSDLAKPLQGRILLKTQDSGKAYYIHYHDPVAFYLGRPNNAFAVMREQGVGIKTSDLTKIPVAYTNLSEADTDKDGLSDAMEDSLGTDKNKKDTDGDGFDDKKEILNSYNPLLRNAKLKVDISYANKQKGKIFLQVEKKGEAWYVANDGKRYFLGRPADAFLIMRQLSLGISNDNFDKLWK